MSTLLMVLLLLAAECCWLDVAVTVADWALAKIGTGLEHALDPDAEP